MITIAITTKSGARNRLINMDTRVAIAMDTTKVCTRAARTILAT